MSLNHASSTSPSPVFFSSSEWEVASGTAYPTLPRREPFTLLCLEAIAWHLSRGCGNVPPNAVARGQCNNSWNLRNLTNTLIIVICCSAGRTQKRRVGYKIRTGICNDSDCRHQKLLVPATGVTLSPSLKREMFARKFRTDAGELHELSAESDCQHGLQITMPKPPNSGPLNQTLTSWRLGFFAMQKHLNTGH